MERKHATPDIVLRSTNPPINVRGSDVYFAFPDGRLDYDCQSCGATCCKGHGYLVQIGRELDAQLRKSPASRMFLEVAERGTGTFHMKNCPPGCFFLQEDHKCGIHVESGYAAKPETCRLFPFNFIRRVGSVLIVRPHPGLCPLSVTATAMRSSRSSHAELLASIAEYGLSAVVPPAFPRSADLDGLLAVERSIVQLASSSLDSPRYIDFAASQLALGRAGASAASISSAAAELDHHFACMAQLLGASPSEENLTHRPSIRALVAATPSLRAALLFPDAPVTGTPAPLDLGFDQVARMLAALSVLVAFAREAGMAAVTIQTVQRIFAQNTELLLLLSAADEPVEWHDDVTIDLRFDGPFESQLRYLEVARALLPSLQADHRIPLHQALSARKHVDPVTNVSFLKQFARKVSGKMSRMSPSTAGSSKFSLRRKTQRWALRHAPLAALAQIARRGTPVAETGASDEAQERSIL